MTETKLTLESFLQELKKFGTLEQLKLALIAAKAYCDYANWSASNTAAIGVVPDLAQKTIETNVFFWHYVEVTSALGEQGRFTYAPRVRVVDFHEKGHLFQCETVLNAIAQMGKPEMIRIEWRIGDDSSKGQWSELHVLDLFTMMQTVQEMNRAYGDGTHWISSSLESVDPAMVRVSLTTFRSGLVVWLPDTPGVYEVVCNIADDLRAIRPSWDDKRSKRDVCKWEKV